MSDGNTAGGAERRSRDPMEAFELLTHETRMAAMRVLWDAAEPLRFSEIADRAGISDTGNFNYHLGELVGHFVRKEGETYRLTRPGRRAMAAVLSGDITDQPQFEPTRLDQPCPYCGADVLLAHNRNKLRVLCTACDGTWRSNRWNHGTDRPHPQGTVSVLPFPASGVKDRDPAALLRTALTRLTSRWRDATNGICPECGGTTVSTATVCPDHDTEGVCGSCGSRFAGHRAIKCDVCGDTHNGVFPLNGLADPGALTYFWDHGVDLFSPTWDDVLRFLECEERIQSAEPIEAEMVWALDDEPLTVRIGADGRVVAVIRGNR